jgi:fatty acid desaturase
MNTSNFYFLERGHLQRFYKPRGWNLYIWISLIYLSIFCILYCLNLSQVFRGDHPVGFFLICLAAFLGIGWLQYCIAQAFHEVLHQKLGRKNWENFVAGLLTSYPIGLTPSYRQLHLAHHRYPGDPVRDPDYPNYSYFPQSKLAMCWHFLRMLLAFPAIFQFLKMRFERNHPQISDSKPAKSGAKSGRFGETLTLATTQLLILLSFSLAFNPLYYILLWLLPIVTLVKLMNSIRSLCEHGDPEKSFVYRSFTATGLNGLLLGVFGFNKHAEHHIYEMVPYQNLGLLFREHQFREHQLQENQLQENQLQENQLQENQGGLDQGAIDQLAPAADHAYEVYDGTHLDLLWQWFQSLPLTKGSNSRSLSL